MRTASIAPSTGWFGRVLECGLQKIVYKHWFIELQPQRNFCFGYTSCLVILVLVTYIEPTSIRILAKCSLILSAPLVEPSLQSTVDVVVSWLLRHKKSNTLVNQERGCCSLAFSTLKAQEISTSVPSVSFPTWAVSFPGGRWDTPRGDILQGAHWER